MQVAASRLSLPRVCDRCPFGTFNVIRFWFCSPFLPCPPRPPISMLDDCCLGHQTGLATKQAQPWRDDVSNWPRLFQHWNGGAGGGRTSHTHMHVENAHNTEAQAAVLCAATSWAWAWQTGFPLFNPRYGLRQSLPKGKFISKMVISKPLSVAKLNQLYTA